jgi:hypothetical protein
MYEAGSIVPHIRPKVFIDIQMSRIKYIYYINNVSKEYDALNKMEQRKTP